MLYDEILDEEEEMERKLNRIKRKKKLREKKQADLKGENYQSEDKPATNIDSLCVLP
ncbi:MAG: hypothetical protein ACMG6E_08705 [Candidatus Roizmanbacteria bacterium]